MVLVDTRETNIKHTVIIIIAPTLYGGFVLLSQDIVLLFGYIIMLELIAIVTFVESQSLGTKAHIPNSHVSGVAVNVAKPLQ